MKTYLHKLFPLLLFFAMVSVGISHAQVTVVGRQINGFTEEFAPSNWVFTPSAPTFFGSIDASGAPNSILFLGSDINRANPIVQGPDDPSATFSITVPFDGELSFDWQTFHNDLGFDVVVFRVNGANLMSLDGNQVGSFSLPLNQGDVFSIFSFTVDNILGPIDIEISNLVFGFQDILNQEIQNPITYISPLNTSVNQAVNLDLVWEPVSVATSYVVQVSTSPDFGEGDIIFSDNDFEGTTHSLEGLDHQTTYFWRVRPNVPGSPPALEDWMTDDPWYGRPYQIFRTATSIPVVSEFSNNGACLSAAMAQIQWPTQEGASTYYLQVSTDENFAEGERNYTNLPGNTFSFRNLEPGTYFWRVKANGVSALGESSGWSEVQNFSITPRIALSGDASFCEGGSVTLTAPAGSAHQWFMDGEAIEGATSSTYTAMEAGMYSVSLTTEGACEYTSESVHVSINPLPEFTFTATADQICAGGSTTLMVEGAYPFQWYRNGEAIGGNGQTSLEVSQAGSYRVEVRGENGCTVLSDPKIINVFPELDLYLDATATVICEGGTTTLMSGQESIAGLNWYRNGVLVSGIRTVDWTVNQPGVYAFSVTNAAGCTYWSDELEIEQTILDQPTISVNANYEAMLAMGYPVGLFSSAAPSGTAYSWIVNGEPVSGINARGIAILGNATVQVQISTPEGCSVLSETFEVIYPAGVSPVGVQTIELTPAEIEARNIDPETVKQFNAKFTAAGSGSAEQFQAFPNPTEGAMNVVISKDLVGTGATTLSIRNILGREVQSVALTEGQTTYTASINLGSLRNGLYVLQVQGSKGVFRKTVKKE